MKYAKEEFTNGSLQTKKEILSALGWNHQLDKGKLVISQAPWLNMLKTGEKLLLPQIKRLELIKNPLTAKENAKKDKLFSEMRSGRDSNPRTDLTPSAV